MRTAISIPPFADATTLVEMAVEAEAAGWDGVFIWDHVQWESRLGLDVHDPWVLLGAMAVRTERVRLGTLVTPLARRRPWMVAKELTTLDHLSNGRATLGVGVGEPAVDDFGAFGDPEPRKERAAILDDALTLLDGLLRGGPVSHHSSHHDVEAELRPRPVQDPRPPIWVAAIAPYVAGRERGLRWDGIATLRMDTLMTPDHLASYLEGVQRPADWDVVANWAPGIPAAEYADAGATWLFDSAWPEDEGWLDEFRSRIRKGPER